MPRGKKSGRAASGDGSIRKKIVKKNGKEYTYWEGRYTCGFDPKSGKQKQHSISGKTQAEVAQKLREITAEDRAGYIQRSLQADGGRVEYHLGQGLSDQCKTPDPRGLQKYSMHPHSTGAGVD
jgi:hypothetical protein